MNHVRTQPQNEVCGKCGDQLQLTVMNIRRQKLWPITNEQQHLRRKKIQGTRYITFAYNCQEINWKSFGDSMIRCTTTISE